jgi:hypothetical protein
MDSVTRQGPSPNRCSTPGACKGGSPSSDFGENQLSPGSIGISPLPTAPPMAFQRQRVRASIRLSPNFTLAMGSSPGFGSSPPHFRPLRTRFRSGSAPEGLCLARREHSPVHSSIGTPSPPTGARTAWGRTVSGSLSLPSRGAFHRSLTVLCAIGR